MFLFHYIPTLPGGMNMQYWPVETTIHPPFVLYLHLLGLVKYEPTREEDVVLMCTLEML